MYESNFVIGQHCPRTTPYRSILHSNRCPILILCALLIIYAKNKPVRHYLFIGPTRKKRNFKVNTKLTLKKEKKKNIHVYLINSNQVSNLFEIGII